MWPKCNLSLSSIDRKQLVRFKKLDSSTNLHTSMYIYRYYTSNFTSVRTFLLHVLHFLQLSINYVIAMNKTKNEGFVLVVLRVSCSIWILPNSHFHFLKERKSSRWKTKFYALKSSSAAVVVVACQAPCHTIIIICSYYHRCHHHHHYHLVVRLHHSHDRGLGLAWGDE